MSDPNDLPTAILRACGINPSDVQAFTLTASACDAPVLQVRHIVRNPDTGLIDTIERVYRDVTDERPSRWFNQHGDPT